MKALVDYSDQGSLDWKIKRIPYVTASEVKSVMAKGQGKTRTNYMHRKLCEILTGLPTPTFKNDYMQGGNDKEEFARQLYMKIYNCNVSPQAGFWYLPDEKLGASLDGDIADSDGIIEIKNLVATEQVKLIVTKRPDSGHIKQVQTQLYVRDKKWCDYIGLSLGSEEHGVLPDKYKFTVVRIERDEEMITEIRQEVAKFHADLNELRKKLENIKERG